MLKKPLVIIILVFIALATMGTAFAQDTNNWCFEGQPWGDGRCNNPDPNIQNYNWVAGWCGAQTASGMPMQACMLSQGLLGKAVDDIYRTDDGALDCRWRNYVDIEEGLLANDEGSNLEMVDIEWTNPSDYMFIWWEGDFYFEGQPGIYEIEYTLNTGATATAELVLCPGLDDQSAFWR